VDRLYWHITVYWLTGRSRLRSFAAGGDIEEY